MPGNCARNPLRPSRIFYITLDAAEMLDESQVVSKLCPFAAEIADSPRKLMCLGVVTVDIRFVVQEIT